MANIPSIITRISSTTKPRLNLKNTTITISPSTYNFHLLNNVACFTIDTFRRIGMVKQTDQFADWKSAHQPSPSPGTFHDAVALHPRRPTAPFSPQNPSNSCRYSGFRLNGVPKWFHTKDFSAIIMARSSWTEIESDYTVIHECQRAIDIHGYRTICC